MSLVNTATTARFTLSNSNVKNHSPVCTNPTVDRKEMNYVLRSNIPDQYNSVA